MPGRRPTPAERLRLAKGIGILLGMQAGLKDIAQRHGIVLALRFGSSVTGRVHPNSDVDIAILLNRSAISLREHADLLQDLQSLFPEGEVDLALINHADPLFLTKITDTCHLL